MSTLKEIHNLFIVSKFSDPEEIANALDLVRICRNYIIFITVITPRENQSRTDLFELKNSVDVFLCLENEYYEEEKITDPVSYAVDFMAHSYYNKFGSGARQPAGLHSISCLSYNKRSNWLATHSLVLPCP